jgi:hypothetical protein
MPNPKIQSVLINSSDKFYACNVNYLDASTLQVRTRTYSSPETVPQTVKIFMLKAKTQSKKKLYHGDGISEYYTNL